MPPQQPVQGSGPTMPLPPDHGSGQFDFIMSTGSASHTPSPLTSVSTPKRILIVGGGLLVLLFVGWIFLSIISKPTGVNTAALLSIAQKQTELVRIAQPPVQQAANPSTRDFAETTYLVLLTDQQAFLKYMGKHGLKPSSKQLSATQSSATNTALTQAQTVGTYDSTFISIAQSELTTYGQALSQAFTASKSLSERQLLQTSYQQTQLLLAMSKQTY